MDRERFLGGSPVGVLIRLVLLSIIVGVVLSALGISPANFLTQLNILARRLLDLGFGALEWILQYFLIGAIVVFPIWLIARLLRAFAKRSDDRGV